MRDGTNRFSASCSPQHWSQENLFRWHSISLALNWRRQEVTLEFGSISIDRSKNASSRDVTCDPASVFGRRMCVEARHTVSQVRHRVSFVNTPSNNL